MFNKLAILSISSRCNHRCVFCSDEVAHDAGIVDLKVVDQTLVRLAARGYDAVNFMAAESTLRRDFTDVLARVHHHGLRAALTTNGVHFAQRRYAEAVIPQLACIEVSLHAHEPDTFRAITGRNTLDHVCRGLTNIARVARAMDEPCVIVVNVVVCQLNLDAPAGVVRLLAELDLGTELLVTFIRARRAGRARQAPELLAGLGACADAFHEGVAEARRSAMRCMFRGLPTCLPLDEVGHNFLTLELLTRPEYAFLNREPLAPEVEIDCNVGLDRIGRQFPAVCHGCGLQRVCPGLESDVSAERWDEITPPDPCPSEGEVRAALEGGPLGWMLTTPRPQ